MRTIKLLGETESLKKWYLTPKASSWDNKFYFPELGTNAALEELVINLKKNDYYSEAYKTHGKKLLLANSEWLSQRLPHADSELRNFLYTKYSLLLRKGEVFLFSAIALNDFLAQEPQGSYGEFLGTHWDDLYSSMNNASFNLYPDTPKIFKLFERREENVLLLKPRSSKVVQDALESLTVEELRRLSNKPAEQLRSKVSYIPDRIEQLLGGGSKSLPKLRDIQDDIFQLFSQAVVQSGRSSRMPHHSLAEVLIRYIDDIPRAFYDELKLARKDSRPSNELKSFTDSLKASTEKLLPVEYLAILFVLISPDSITSTPAGGRKILKSLEKQTDSYRVQMLRNLGQLALTQKIFPSANDWITRIEDGTLEFASSGADAFAYMEFKTSGASNMTKAHMKFKELTRGF